MHSSKTTTDDSSDKANFQFEYTRHTKRSSSSVILKSLTRDKAMTFQPERILGKGTNAIVREFSAKDRTLAVKKPVLNQINFEDETHRDRYLAMLEKELAMTEAAYPNEAPYKLFNYYHQTTDAEDKFPCKYTYRMLLPMTNGATLAELLGRKIKLDDDIVLAVFWKIAQELNRLHEAGIIHGDISLRNIILTPELRIRFIDFGFAYATTGLTTVVNVENKQKCRFAPERVNVGKPCAAHTNQDIYALAYTLDDILHYGCTITRELEFYEKYPLIQDFITKSLSPTPAERPPLSAMIDCLPKVSPVTLLKMSLLADHLEPAQTVLSKHAKDLTATDLYPLIVKLCRDKEVEKAQLLVSHLQIQQPAHLQRKPILELFNTIIDATHSMKKINLPTHAHDRQLIMHNLRTAYLMLDVELNQLQPARAPEDEPLHWAFNRPQFI